MNGTGSVDQNQETGGAAVKPILVSLALLACACLPAHHAAAEPAGGYSSAGAGQSLALPNPDQPFPPSFITTDVGKELQVEDWTDPQVCAGCHPRQWKGWKGSMHSISFVDPVFQAEWALAEKEMDGALMNHCGGCHSPVGVVTGTIRFDPAMAKHGGFTTEGVAREGVSCDVCHTISGNNLLKTAVLEHGNASIVLSPGNIKRGPLRDAKSPFHETAFSEHHTKAEFCGNCHNIFHPQNNFPVERTYDEWKYSAYAQADIQCQDCHMVPVEIAMRVADEMKPAAELENHGLGGIAGMGGFKPRSIVHDHGFVGGNAVVAPALGVQGGEEHAAIARKRLQNVAALDLELEQRDGALHDLRVKVENRRAGHHLPTSLTHVRQVWLEVVVTDDQGKELLRSGTLDERGSLPADAVTFDNKAVDAEGKLTHKPWRIVRFEEMNTIPPRGFRYGRYSFNVPESAEGFTVTARLYYRSFDQELADYLLGEGAVTVPSVEMEMLERSYDRALEVVAERSSNDADAAATEVAAAR